MIDERSRRGAPDSGFTLIEVLVVLLIMAVLMAITVPSYIGLQASTREAATKSDLGSDRTALVAYGIDNNGVFPKKSDLNTETGSLLTGYGWQKSPETDLLTYSPNAARTSWCLEGKSVTGTVFRVSPSNPTAVGTCSSLGEANY